MTTELKTRWIEALRSGEYDQGRLNLKSDEFGTNEKADFCCLGVLCDLVDSSKWKRSESGEYFTFEGRSDYPPAEILSAVQLTYEDAQMLATFNDDDGYRFEDIANYLETGKKLVDCEACLDEGVLDPEGCPECGR